MQVPSSRPKLTKSEAEKILKAKNVGSAPVCVLAVRGYYSKMGGPGNDRSIFDDAAFVCSPTAFVSVNWNTDPSSYRKGRGTGAYKGMASLKLGVWDYKIGAHKGVSPACRQADDVTVIRDGDSGDYEDTGDFAINHHWGSNSGGTSSAGCQTAPPSQWPSYINALVGELKRYGQKTFKYVLIDESEMNAILGDAEPVPVNGHALDLAPALEVIKEFEGYFSKAYLDPVNIPTIGWGTIAYPDGRKVKLGDTCTPGQASDWIMHEIEVDILNPLADMVTVPLSNNERCALISFCYNLGAGALKKSTLLKLLNAGVSKTQVANELDKWIMAGGQVLRGLVRRRAAEKNLFLA